MAYHYAHTIENSARAVSTNMSISRKSAIEIANSIRGKRITAVRRMLQDAIALERPFLFTRFNGDTGHKSGVGAGRFAVKTAEHMLKLVNSAVSNAEDKGMDTARLQLAAIVVQQGPKSPRYGRHRGRMGKSVHIEVAVTEAPAAETKPKATKPATKKAATKKAAPKAAAKSESKPAEKKTEAEKPAETAKPAETKNETQKTTEGDKSE